MPDDPTHSDWHALFDRHAAGLILFARQWCRTHADAEDVVQEVFVDRWRQAVSADDPPAYLYICVRHAAMDQRRTQMRRLRREQHAAAMQDGVRNESMFEDRQIDREQAAMLENRLNGLPDDQRQVLVLKMWSGLTFAQIAQVMETSANTAASRYRYALETLRRDLKQEMIR